MSRSTIFLLLIANMLGISAMDCPDEDTVGGYEVVCEVLVPQHQQKVYF